MSEPVTSSDSGASPQSGGKHTAASFRLRALAPHVLTAIAAVLITLGAQRLLPPPSAAPAVATQTPSPAAPVATVTPDVVAAATTTPAPTEPPLAAAISRQELIDLRAQDDRLWAAVYLIRALNQIADAEAAMRVNDLASVEQSLTALDETLAQAYARAADPDRDPIDQIRRDAGAMREDLYPRPEGMDIRFGRLRQAIMTLLEARR